MGGRRIDRLRREVRQRHEEGAPWFRRWPIAIAGLLAGVAGVIGSFSTIQTFLFPPHADPEIKIRDVGAAFYNMSTSGLFPVYVSKRAELDQVSGNAGYVRVTFILQKKIDSEARNCEVVLDKGFPGSPSTKEEILGDIPIKIAQIEKSFVIKLEQVTGNNHEFFVSCQGAISNTLQLTLPK